MIIDEAKTSIEPATDCTIWRYMDFAKYIDLLDKSKLAFPRSDKFEDPYEGLFSKATINKMRDQKRNGNVPAEFMELHIQHNHLYREEFYISCWHESEFESAAMWKLYLKSKEGVAIKTNYSTLKAALHSSNIHMYLSKVKYIDYETEHMVPEGNIFAPFIHKRLSFSHEREIRAMIWRRDERNKHYIGPLAESAFINVELKQLIHAVHVCPQAPEWFGQLVEDISLKYDLQAPIVRSSLYDRPSA